MARGITGDHFGTYHGGALYDVETGRSIKFSDLVDTHKSTNVIFKNVNLTVKDLLGADGAELELIKTIAALHPDSGEWGDLVDLQKEAICPEDSNSTILIKFVLFGQWTGTQNARHEGVGAGLLMHPLTDRDCIINCPAPGVFGLNDTINISTFINIKKGGELCKQNLKPTFVVFGKDFVVQDIVLEMSQLITG